MAGENITVDTMRMLGLCVQVSWLHMILVCTLSAC